ncbi:hypothetical protein DPMN_139083 [Dreissena polymorpha]|uniref:Uncharacterized protein n=1 Tax=Dreissena polymorpha TaxID=45954 RepID=A0A9D4G8H9_DREPO|nr:hypothetical protein DPMN_139083 [Dreissena polymorpha]
MGGPQMLKKGIDNRSIIEEAGEAPIRQNERRQLIGDYSYETISPTKAAKKAPEPYNEKLKCEVFESPSKPK